MIYKLKRLLPNGVRTIDYYESLHLAKVEAIQTINEDKRSSCEIMPHEFFDGVLRPTGRVKWYTYSYNDTIHKVVCEKW